MDSTGGLTRRRGGATVHENGEGSPSSRVASPTPKQQQSQQERRIETNYSSSENGHKIAFDPRDISESAERDKQPKLTLMEEILLLGLKDKQVRPPGGQIWDDSNLIGVTIGLPVFLERQHFICAPRVHCHRARFQRSSEHAEGFIEKEISPVGPSNRGD